MEAKNSNHSKQVMIKNGLFLGIASVLISVAVYVSGNSFNQHWSVGVFTFALNVFFIALAIKQFKTANEGFLSLSESFKIGLGVAVIAGLISGIYTYIFLNFVEPDFFVQMQAHMEQQWMKQGLSDQDIENAKAIMQKTSGPFATIAFSIIATIFFGFIISLVTGLIMKQKREE